MISERFANPSQARDINLTYIRYLARLQAFLADIRVDALNSLVTDTPIIIPCDPWWHTLLQGYTSKGRWLLLSCILRRHALLFQSWIFQNSANNIMCVCVCACLVCLSVSYEFICLLIFIVIFLCTNLRLHLSMWVPVNWAAPRITWTSRQSSGRGVWRWRSQRRRERSRRWGRSRAPSWPQGETEPAATGNKRQGEKSREQASTLS